ncbi:hypothetical protein [Halothiobacillus diazotrophicus]|uniref:hypothetical protein n=1 Tax=Halothiobacillus diazotrophicus TaxID=1860122 RepID=UPI0012E7C927|nr:hypothetical protein [Halothiobacillus diazotrophicus]
MKLHLLATLVFAVLATPAVAESRVCSLKDQQWISNELPSLSSWPAIHKSFKKYVPQCDDGFIAEGYTESVVVLLANHWPSVQEFSAIAKRDPGFRKFVLHHIDASADPDDLKRIESQAKNNCPPKQEAICSEIHSAAVRAIKDL